MANTQSANRIFTIQEIGANNNTWGDNLNANWERVDNILGDTTTIATTGGNTALTDDEQDVAIVKTSGVLVSNAEIRFDARRGTWIVYNDNTGAFITTFIVAGQTGVSVTQGSYAIVYSNGTDIVEVSLRSDLVNDTTPQLGGDLDANAFDIQFDDATGIRDDSDNEQLIFQKTASAVNHWEMTNAAAGSEPLLQAVGGDTDVSARISSKGADTIELAIDGTNKLTLSGTVLYPTTTDGIALGSTTNMFADLFLATGAVINFNNGDVTITHSANTLTFAGASSGYAFDVAPNVAGTALAKVTQTTEPFYGMILGSLSNRDYRIVLKATEAGTITETTTRSVSGSATATFKVNTTALGGTANAVSSSEQSQAHAATNTFVAGDDIVITISANSSCVDMSFAIKWTRTLA